MKGELEQQALDNPKVGDYWHEMFCPYFLVVDILADNKFVILSAWEDKKNNVIKSKVDSTHGWYFDPEKYSIVSKQWIKETVMYKSLPKFVARVLRNKMPEACNEYQANCLKQSQLERSLNQYNGEFWLGV